MERDFLHILIYSPGARSSWNLDSLKLGPGTECPLWVTAAQSLEPSALPPRRLELGTEPGTLMVSVHAFTTRQNVYFSVHLRCTVLTAYLSVICVQFSFFHLANLILAFIL